MRLDRVGAGAVGVQRAVMQLQRFRPRLSRASRAALAGLTVRKGIKREDVEYWLEERNLVPGLSKEGRRIYGENLDEQKTCELFD